MDALLGYGVAIILSLMSVGTFIKWSDTGAKNIVASAVAGQNIMFNKAAAQYVQDYATTIAETATSSSPVTISASTLINAGYLPSGFSSTNAYGQTWEAQVLQPSTDELETLVIATGGTAISDQLQLVKIAAQVGAEGGFIPYSNQGGDSTMSSSYARGAYGGWKQSLTNFTNPGSGHLASLLAFTNTATNTNYLYRVAVSGESQLNAMQTDLSLTDTSGTEHDITGVAQIQIEAGDGVQIGDSYIYGDSSNTAVRQSGGFYVQNAAGTGYEPIYAGAVTANGSVTATGAVTSSSYIVPGNIATSGSSCSPNGAIGTNGTQLLLCKSGVWAKPYSSISRMTWTDSSSGSNYGDICLSDLQSSGYADEGWVATGADACSEDDEFCSVDNVRCFAILLQ